MLHLIVKDIVLQRNTFFILLPLLVVYMLLNSPSLFIGIIFCIAFTMQAFAADEKSQIHLLLNSLPYTKKEIVSAKYLGALVITIIIALTVVLGHLIIHGELFSWKELLLMLYLVMLYVSFSFPVSYKFKSSYLMIAFFAAFAAYLVVINLFVPNLNDLIRELVGKLLAMQAGQLYTMAGGIVFGVYVLSWLLSLRIYYKKAA